MKRLDGKRIYLDANAFIYFGENHPTLAEPMERVFSSAHAGRCSLVTSELTLAEVLVLPFKQQNQALADLYTAALTASPYLAVLPLHRHVIIQSARLRAMHDIRLPDAIHMATAIEASCDVLLSEDKGLQRLQEIQGIRISELAGAGT